MTETFKIGSHAQTDPGKVRDHNEDSMFSDDGRCVWAVADGMGGHERGEWASAALVEAMSAISTEGAFDSRIAQTADAIHSANAVIFTEAQNKSISMGSTIVALVLGDNRFGVVWAGDSRCYVLRDGVLHQLSRDHTRVQELIDRGLLTEEQAVGHPMGHVLSRAVGVGAELELDAIVDDLHGGDLFLLCSDGLYGMMSDAEIAEVMTTTAYENIADVLIEKCLDRGAHDNVTVIVVRAAAGTVLAFAPQT